MEEGAELDIPSNTFHNPVWKIRRPDYLFSIITRIEMVIFYWIKKEEQELIVLKQEKRKHESNPLIYKW